MFSGRTVFFYCLMNTKVRAFESKPYTFYAEIDILWSAKSNVVNFKNYFQDDVEKHNPDLNL